MNKGLNKLIFQVMRSIIVEDPIEANLTADSFTKAVTMNENLKSYGYTLNSEDIIRVSKLVLFR